MDRNKALDELRRVSERMCEAEVINFEILRENLDIDDDVDSMKKELKLFASKVLECMDFDKVRSMINEGQLIYPEKTKEDFRGNQHKIFEEAFDFDKFERIQIAFAVENEENRDKMRQWIANIISYDSDRKSEIEFFKKFFDMQLETIDFEKYREVVNQMDDADNVNRQKITVANIPIELRNIQKDRDRFWNLLNEYRERKNLTHKKLRQKSGVSVAVYHNIRHMPENAQYNPDKITVLELCIAMHLTLEETKELLGLIGSTLSEHLFFDRIISYCLNQNEYDYDVEDINEIIYDITGRSPFIKY